MLLFIILFCTIGYIVGRKANLKIAMIIFCIITILWAFVFGPWALATFIELIIGYGVAKEVEKSD
jgi:hypothetical protein